MHGVGVQVLPIATAPEPLGPYSLVQEGVPDSAAVQITTAGTGGGESPHHGGDDPVMSEGWSSPSMVIAVDGSSLQVKEGTARAHARAAWPARLAGSALDTSTRRRAASTSRKMCLPSTAPPPSVTFKPPSWVLI